MMRQIKKFMQLCGLAVAIGLFSAGASAQQPIRLLVGFPPGGTTDVLARMVAHRLSDILGRTIVVENRPGASGSIAAGRVADASADGNTLLFVPSTHATNATLYPNLPYDPIKSFRAVGMVAATPYVLVVNPEIKAESFSEFVEFLKKNPGEVEFASASPGTGQHLAGELFKAQAGVDILHVPYKGSAAALPDLIAGRVPMMFDNIAVMLPHIRSGALHPLAITSKSRSRLLPEVPTVAESGLPDFEVLGWFALMAPAGTSDEAIQPVSQALEKVAEDPKFVAGLEKLGAEPDYRDPSSTDAFIANEVAKWRKVIDDAGIKLN